MTDHWPAELLLWSRTSRQDLLAEVQRLQQSLRAGPTRALSDIAYTLQVGRRAFEHRRMVVVHDLDDAVHTLETVDSTRVKTAVRRAEAPDVVFMFSGQGAQYVGMGSELYRTEPVFRAQLDRCAEILAPQLSLDLRDILYPREAAVACRLLNVKKVIPMHFGTFPPLTGKPAELAKLVEAEVLALEPGKPVSW